jgi:tripartite ATP-independent transporter DctM subunit
MSVALLFVITVVFILIRIPLGAGMLLASLIVVVLEGLPIEIVPMRIFAALLPFPILAVPLFYVAGIACNATSITAQIMNLANALVGRLRAGLAHVNIVSSMLFAGISGSSLADTAGIGSVLMPQMIRAGYSKSFVVALTATTSTLGNIVPPSLVMVAYGAFGNVSVGMLFLGGIIPSLMFGFLMMGLVIFLSRVFGVGKDDYTSERVPILPALRGGWAPAMVPVIIVGGIVGGVFTATESAAVAILYILILGIMRRDLSLKDIIKLTGDTGKFIGLIMPLLAASVVFAWFLSYYEFPAMLVGLFEAFGVGRYGVLFSITILFLVLGTLVEPIPAIIMFLPTIHALTGAAGIHPVQIGVIVVMAGAIGLATPPHGVCLLVASQIVGIHPRTAMLYTLLLSCVGLSVLLLAIFIPDITLLLPRLLMSRYF